MDEAPPVDEAEPPPPVPSPAPEPAPASSRSETSADASTSDKQPLASAYSDSQTVRAVGWPAVEKRIVVLPRWEQGKPRIRPSLAHVSRTSRPRLA